jgi:HEAT repeat protein
MKLLERLFRRKPSATVWVGALEGLGLRSREGADDLVLQGEVEGAPLELHLDPSYARVREMRAPVLLPAGMGFARATREGTPTGDRAFDAEVTSRGEARLLHPLLGRPTRDLLRRTIRTRSIEVRESFVRCTAASMLGSALALRATIEAVAGLARHLDRRWIAFHERPEELFAENALRDPVTAIRRANLALFADRFADSPSLRKVCRLVVRDPDPELRLAAAIQMGRGGLPALQALVADSSITDRVRTHALDEIVRGRPDLRFLRRVLHDRSAVLRLRAIEVLGRSRQRAAIAPLAALVPRLDGRGRVAIAEALGAIGHRDGEPALIGLLGGPRAQKTAAAKALGAAGTAECVEALTALARAESDVRRTALESLAKIRRRLRGAEPGQLTIAEGGTNGALSVAAEGALSFPRRR